MKYELVLFDLDGTLTDTLGAISKIINMAMEEMNLGRAVCVQQPACHRQHRCNAATG